MKTARVPIMIHLALGVRKGRCRMGRKSQPSDVMSALPPTADIASAAAHVGFVPISDIAPAV